MATLLSEEFLTVHPATLAWWERRERCERCTQSRVLLDGAMRCRALRQVGPNGSGFCIDARLPDGPCGPEAKLFKEKKT